MKPKLRKEQLVVGVLLEDKFGRVREIVEIEKHRYRLTHKHSFLEKNPIPGKWWSFQELLEKGDRVIFRP